MSCDTDQEKQNSQADKNQTDCFLVIGRNFHLVREQSNIIGRQKSSALFESKALMWLVHWIKVSFWLLALLIVGFRLNAQIDRITGKNFATRSEVLARHGMVCTSVPAATEVGIDILKRGGSAVDAAIAANATLGLMEPVSNGIGGDLFAIVYSAKENKLYGINGSGRSPAGLSYDQIKAELEKLQKPPSPQSFPWPGRGGRAASGEGRALKIPPTGMLPISVPGTVDAWAELHKRFG